MIKRRGIGTKLMVFALAVLTVHCGQVIKGAGEPFDEAVTVESFLGNRTIALRWREDVNADEYVLMRAKDEAWGLGGFEEIYRGQRTSFIDKAIEMGCRYVYRLDKAQGWKSYRGEQTGIGVGNTGEADLNEPNDRREEATALGTFKRGTMYYYRFSDGRELADIDFYKARVSGGTSEYIQIKEEGAHDTTSMTIQMPGKEAVIAEQGKWYELKNETAEERELYIQLRPDVEQYAGSGMAGGMIKSYTIIRSAEMEEAGIGGTIEERSDFFVPDGSGGYVFLLNEGNYARGNYTFWRYLDGDWDGDQGMSMELSKESGNFLGGYGFFFAGGHVEGYGDCKLVVLIQKDGNYAVGKVVAGKYESLQGWVSSIYLRTGYGVRNTVEVKKAGDEYVIRINEIEAGRIVDAHEPICEGNRKGLVGVVTWMEVFPEAPVTTWYMER